MATPGAPATNTPSSGVSVARRLRVVGAREAPLAVLIALTIIAMTIVNPAFASLSNLRAVAIGLTPDAIIAIAMTVLLISGGFDLSVGSVLALTGVVAALTMDAGAPWPAAVLAAVVVGAMVGAFNGLIVTRVGVNALVTTLGTLTMVSSITLVVSGGSPRSGFPDAFLTLGQGSVYGLPVAVLIMLVGVIVGDQLLRRASAARLTYYVGSNAEAALLSGISVQRVRLAAFILVGVAAAIAGVIAAARLNAAFPLAGQGTELRVIAACVIGGCTLSGGQGSVLGSFLGVVLLGLVTNVLILMRVDVSWQGFVTGGILIAAVALDQLTKARTRRRLVAVRRTPAATGPTSSPP